MSQRHRLLVTFVLPALLALAATTSAQPPNPVAFDLAAIGTGESLRRVLGSIGDGRFGVPVAGGSTLMATSSRTMRLPP